VEFESFSFIFLMAVGFGLAAFTMTVFHLATGRPLGFAFGEMSNAAIAPLAIGIRAIAGPGILVRNAFQSGMTVKSDPVWLMIGLIVAGLWALSSGMLIMTSLGPLASMG
jgi:hypothetical protein